MHIVLSKMEPESGVYTLSQTFTTTVQNTGWMMRITAGMPQLIWQMPGRQNGGLIGNLHFLLVAEGNAVNSWARARGVEVMLG